MAVDGDEEPGVELEGAGELLHELPHALQELIHDGGHLLRVSHQVVAPGGEEEEEDGSIDTARKIGKSSYNTESFRCKESDL